MLTFKKWHAVNMRLWWYQRNVTVVVNVVESRLGKKINEVILDRFGFSPNIDKLLISFYVNFKGLDKDALLITRECH